MLVQRIGRDHGAQLGQHLPVLAEGEPGVGERVLGFLALVEQAFPGRDGGHVGERRLPPQAQGLAQQGGRVPGGAAVERILAAAGEVAELVQVELARLDRDQVTGRVSAQPGGVRQRLADPVDAAA